MANLQAANLVDAVLAGSNKSGYKFVVTPTAAVPNVSLATFTATANPIVTSGVSQSGTRRFGITEDGVMHGDAAAATLGTAMATADLTSTTNVLGN